MQGLLAFVALLLGCINRNMQAVNVNPVNVTTTSFPFNNTTRTDTTLKELSTEGNVEETTRVPTGTKSSDGACNITFNCSSELVTSVKNNIPAQTSISRETYLAILKHNNPINVFLFMLAFVLNGFNIVVFISQDQNSTNFYLIAISVMDILYSTCVVGKTLYHMLSDDVFTWFYNTYIIYIELYFRPVFQRTIFFLVFLVSIERLLVVVFPLKAKTFVFMRRPKSIIMMAFLIPSVYYVFSPFRYKLIEITTDQNTTKYTLTYKHPDQTFLRGMSTTDNFLFVYALLLGGLFLNLLVVCALKRYSKKRQQWKTTIDTDKTARQERQTTVTIITSSLVFLFLALPHATNAMAFSLFPSIYGPYTRYHYLFSVLQALCSTLTNLSLCTDFLAYIWLSTSFRTTFFRILRIRQTSTPTRYTDENTDHTHTS
ncbi:probable G-protein coupled receptor B0563.6 [Haliotis rubra]|uniref:probable G-protein coupled receptor B0563.6 n=1 Tax=Haliotis rubra TaxID=36100 RepID=UPI001EE5B545|nr:probable G-protein coupled receptor B0563.6 [Haliotis rubra]